MAEDYIYTISSSKRDAQSLYQMSHLQHLRYTTTPLCATLPPSGLHVREARRSGLNGPIAVGVGGEEGALRYRSDVRMAHY